jgi:hypothetical protein
VVGAVIGLAIMAYHWRIGKEKNSQRMQRQGKEYRNMVDAV